MYEKGLTSWCSWTLHSWST